MFNDNSKDTKAIGMENFPSFERYAKLIAVIYRTKTNHNGCELLLLSPRSIHIKSPIIHSTTAAILSGKAMIEKVVLG
jgi:hypothetical protein